MEYLWLLPVLLPAVGFFFCGCPCMEVGDPCLASWPCGSQVSVTFHGVVTSFSPCVGDPDSCEAVFNGQTFVLLPAELTPGNFTCNSATYTTTGGPCGADDFTISGVSFYPGANRVEVGVSYNGGSAAGGHFRTNAPFPVGCGPVNGVNVSANRDDGSCFWQLGTATVDIEYAEFIPA